MYLAALAGCILFYVSYQQWISWIFLVTAVCLPLLSLLVSLPAMFLTKVRLRLPEQVTLSEKIRPELVLSGFLPWADIKGKLYMENLLTGEKESFPAGKLQQLRHCGMYVIGAKRLRRTDYLGLFPLKLRSVAECSVLVMPAVVPMDTMPDMTPAPVRLWRPKAGGGFSENHDLRLYRPGDNLRQIHWKVSAKTGKLIYREPIEPVKGKTVVALSLFGSPEQLDKALGQLLWLGNRLLDKQIPFVLRCTTGQDVLSWEIRSPEQLDQAVKRLLRTPAAKALCLPDITDAGRCYVIGGEPDA